MRKKLSVFFAFLTLAALLPVHSLAMGKPAPKPDPITESSMLDGDATGLVEGCDSAPGVGHVYCREVEGSAANKSLSFIGPPAECDRPACVFVTVYDGQGRVAWGDSIPKGKTRVAAPWGKLLGRDTFELHQRGIWSFVTEVFSKDAQGREIRSVSQGDIILRVYRAGYKPLHNVVDDPAFTWTWIDGGSVFKVTRGLRAYVGRL